MTHNIPLRISYTTQDLHRNISRTMVKQVRNMFKARATIFWGKSMHYSSPNKFLSNKRQNLVIAVSHHGEEGGKYNKYRIKRKGKPTQLKIHTTFQRKLEKKNLPLPRTNTFIVIMHHPT